MSLLVCFNYRPDQKLQLILCGTTERGESSFKIKYIRQRVQEQYKWKPERKLVSTNQQKNSYFNPMVPTIYAGGY